MPMTRPTLLILALGLALAGCSTAPSKTAEQEATPVLPPFKGGGYYKDDGPGANPPANLADIPDATPRWEPLHRFANAPYRVLGRDYVPVSGNQPYKAQGLASWYGRKFHGKSTSTGEPYDMYAMTAAHPTLPLPSYARVTNLENGKSVVVRVNDRGPFHKGRIIDLSYTAAYKLDVLKGVTPVEVETVLPEDAPSSFTALADAPFAPPAQATVASAKLETSAPEVVPERVQVAAAPTTPAEVPVAGAGPVYLQLGAFSRLDTADGLMARASAILSREFPGVLRLQSNGLHKVQAGPFTPGAQAERAAALVREELGIRAFRVSDGAQAAHAAPASTPTTVDASTEAVAKPTALPLAAAPAVLPVTPGLYLQLAALSTPAAANAYAERVRSRYGDTLPGVTRINIDSLFKVQAGPFATPEEAQRVALAYQQDFGVRPYRVVR
ncbi:MAG: septal ring lytic transglycosylase RlpA family protein [Betaproteobacteria bacterium]|nr:septal ring lytic transglycosylase RlpA family protein [Betaproteobacteria bacterium]